MKQPNWKMPLILSTTLAVVGGFTYWLQYSHKPKQEKSDSATKKPLAVADDAQIAAFKIKSKAGLIEGKCDDLAKKNCKVNSSSNWTISYPQNLKADPESVKAFINDAASILATEVIDLSEDTAEKRTQLMDEYGLSADKRTHLDTQFVEFVLEDGKRITAWFGIEHPMGDKTFVAHSENGIVDDKKIFLISNFFKSNFDKTLTHFRDKKLFEFDRANIESFEAKTTASKLSASKADGKWTINGYQGNYEQIETVLSAISQLKAIEFPAASVIKGLKPIVSYDLKQKDKHHKLDLYVRVVKLDHPMPSYEEGHDEHDGHDHGREPNAVKTTEVKHFFAVVSDRPDPVEVSAIIRTQIDKSISDLRNGIILATNEKVTTTRVMIEGKDYPTPAVFEFKGGTWNTNTKMDSNHVPKLLETLSTSAASDFTSVPKAARTQEITITLGDEKSPDHHRFSFFSIKAGKGESIYAVDLKQNKEALLLNESIYKNALPFNPDAWKMKP